MHEENGAFIEISSVASWNTNSQTKVQTYLPLRGPHTHTRTHITIAFNIADVIRRRIRLIRPLRGDRMAGSTCKQYRAQGITE